MIKAKVNYGDGVYWYFDQYPVINSFVYNEWSGWIWQDKSPSTFSG